MNTAKGHVKIPVKGLKVSTLLAPALLTPDLVGPEGQPAGEVTFTLEIENIPTPIRAVVNGKSVRKALRAIAEHGPDDVVVLLQGNLKAGADAGHHVLDTAGLTCTPRVAPKDADGPPAP